MVCYEKKTKKAKYLTQNSINLSLLRRSACQTLSKALDISSASVRAAPDLLKVPAILPDTTVRRYTADREVKNICIYIYIYIHTQIFPPSADKQTCNYDTECSYIESNHKSEKIFLLKIFDVNLLQLRLKSQFKAEEPLPTRHRVAKKRRKTL